ncbi:hypothetical protein CI109_101447 [Kwoniella shandongensis]|uniref:MICOS complex subunit MIC60 n=1 Tax=Kwoniella shandongensis TaxID=1734106 RepID=A0A5M6BUP3_9TREE|nr:uncharacterized protein CI109_005143 [Kwoniella shandongensis]KAA5526567.1 hypothetical protein CI109_005143 [Kwoniella shandongensis]
MYGQMRVARSRAARSTLLPQRRLLATPPPPPPRSTLPPTPPSVAGAVPTRPVVVTTTVQPLTPGSSTLATPIPPRKPRRPFRRFLIYTALGVLVFYPLSGYVSTLSEDYREFFTANFPGGEAVADYIDDNGLGLGVLGSKAVDGYKYVTGQKEETKTEKIERKIGEVRKEAAKVPAQVKEKAVEAKDAVVGRPTTAQRVAEKADEYKKAAIAKTHQAEEKIKEFAGEAKDKVQGATSSVPFNFSEGVEGIVREAEKALGTTEKKIDQAEKKVEQLAHDAKDALTPAPGPRVSPDTQRPRELRPETVTPQKPSYEGKQLYTGPPLPLGFEPPPGYYLAPPPSAAKKVENQVDEAKPTLPLLVPKVKEFAAEEPIISQLASTIDSLTTSLSTPSQALSPDATGILSKAQDDLTALNQRLQDVKKVEKEKLEKTVNEKTKEFEALLKGKEEERTKSEKGLKQTWESERQGLVENWRKELEGELESQRQGIEQRLREEVVSQGIELQRRWLRSIKTQVETERGGRLAKLDTLTTSLKQLERITLDNSASLDDNLRLHKIWSALRAVQHKAEAGDKSFDDELRALKGLAPVSEHTENVIATALQQLERSGIPQTGVKSFTALSSWFSNVVAPRIHSSSLVPAPEEASVVSHLASAGLSKLLFRPQPGAVEGDNVNAVLARAEWCLSEKDLDGAAREVNSLKGWPGKLASDWLREARRKLEVQQALEIVATEATLNSLLLV